MTDAFYEQHGDAFVSTQWTRGPWSADAQHAGPPAALTGHVLERLPSDIPMRVSRFAFEILRPIPLAPLRVEAKILRGGRRVQLCEAALLAGDDAVALARAWRIRVASQPETEEVTDGTPLRAPGECEPFAFTREVPDPSYMAAMELRTVAGAPFQKPSTVWFRMRIPLVDGDPVTPLVRVLAAADSGNGISAVLDFSMLFINVDLTVHLVREPGGQWVALDSTTRIDPDGIGATETFLWDERGRIGGAAQSLYVGAR